MAILTIWEQDSSRQVCFQPPCKLDVLLRQNFAAVDHPCGGRGSCRKCAVQICGEISDPTEAELCAGFRLSCQITLLGDTQVWLPKRGPIRQIETALHKCLGRLEPLGKRFGAALDIGTTTLVLELFDLKHGLCIGAASMENPQRSVAADIIGRIQAARIGEGAHLRKLICDAAAVLLDRSCCKAGIGQSMVDAMVITGNTTMLYLLCGQDPEPLAIAPFRADRLFDELWTKGGISIYFPPCIHAFVGADITCAILASGMFEKDETALLCDIGTNGELVLWRNGTLYVTSTAAGPAFEGVGISCGCASVSGAVDRIWTEDGKLRFHTIDDAPAIGLCGSGLLDMAAAGLELGQIDDSGTMEAETFAITEGVTLLQRDIRALQLAKAAIAAGIETLLMEAEVPFEEINRLYIAGGFGSHLGLDSAVRIGLLPEALRERVAVLGNAALAGAEQLLLNHGFTELVRGIPAKAVHVDLAGNPAFSEQFVDRMLLEAYGQAEPE